MIEVIVHGPVHEVRMARAPANALDTELLTRLHEALVAAPGAGAQAIVLSSAFPNFFSGGMDVPHLMAVDFAAMTHAWQQFFAVARALAGSPVPVVAAIPGHAPAGGCVLALCCDYRVMGRGNGRIGLNETQVGLAVPEAIQHLMRRVVGPYRAERLIVAGAMLDAESANRLGLVDELVEPDQVAIRACAWLEALLALPRAPMLATRKLARQDLVAALAAFGDAELDAFLAQWNAPDTQAALQALVARLRK
ncbi:MAG: enoyl-CoA hydratase/isomerase family protein [Arenimonas sp.]